MEREKPLTSEHAYLIIPTRRRLKEIGATVADLVDEPYSVDVAIAMLRQLDPALWRMAAERVRDAAPETPLPGPAKTPDGEDDEEADIFDHLVEMARNR